MTLTTVLINIGIAALLLTLLMKFVIKNTDHPILSYIQNYCGILFMFSGWVKAVDPLGTAYKLKDYFAEFDSTFSETWLSFIAPIFPFFAEYAVAVSVTVIVLEIVLGLMLVMGNKNKFAVWTFFLLVLFFTFLTGFTYLTGYVPGGVNFFDFAGWGEFDKNNMKVKDCGCFGDFIKLEPYTSFLKDVALLFPAVLFLIRSKSMHRLFTSPVRAGICGVAAVGLLIYCISNFAWDIPHADFRPFNQGKDVRAQKQIEADAQAETKIVAWKLKHNETGELLTVSNADYMGKDPEKNYKKYKGIYSVDDQVKSESPIPITKISDFVIEDADGVDLTEDILSNPGANLLIVNYKLKGGETVEKTRIVRDSIFTVDTMDMAKGATEMIVKQFDRVVEREETYTDYIWDKDYLAKHAKLKPFTDAAKQAGLPVVMAIGGADEMQIKDFNADTGLDLTYGMADDILLKTIVRSNPGVVLFKDGKVIKKWHINKLPDFATIKR